MLTLKVINYQTGELQEHALQRETQKPSEWIIGRGNLGLALLAG